MKQKDKYSIIAVNPYSGKQCQYKQGVIKPLKKLHYSKRNVTIACIANKDLITELIEISPNIPKENIKDVITDKVYDELQFDPAIEYIIEPIRTRLPGTLDKYQTIIIDKKALKERLQAIAKRTKVIDYAIPAPLLFKSLYKERLIDNSGDDMFLYFGEEDSFVTFYHKGEYLYSKSINYSLKNIYDRFCKLAGEVPMSEKKFKEFLSNDGARKGSSAHRELLIRVFNECFLAINDILIYTKRAYDLDSFRTAYVGLSWDSQNALEPYVKNYLNIKAVALETLYEKSISGKDIDPICALMVLSAKELHAGALTVANFTPYPKPKPLSQRPSGKIVATFFIITALFMIPIIYDFIVGSTLNAKNAILEKKEAKLTRVANSYKQKIAQKREELKALNKAYDKTKKLYDSKVGEVTKVYNKKFHYKFRSEQLSELTKLLKKYDIVSRKIVISDTLYAIELESKDDKQITAFIKELVKKFDKKISNVDIKDIVFNKDEGIYKGVLKIDFQEEAQ